MPGAQRAGRSCPPELTNSETRVLPAANRLRRRVEFAATVRAGRRSARGPIVVHLAFQSSTATDPTLAGGETKPARVGFVIPRTVGCAVERNRVRRRLRHLAFERLGSL